MIFIYFILKNIFREFLVLEFFILFTSATFEIDFIHKAPVHIFFVSDSWNSFSLRFFAVTGAKVLVF